MTNQGTRWAAIARGLLIGRGRLDPATSPFRRVTVHSVYIGIKLSESTAYQTG